MMYRAVWTPVAAAEYQKLKAAAEAAVLNRTAAVRGKASQAEGLFKQVHACVKKLLHNPRHPELNTHKYDSLEHPYEANGAVFEAYAQNQTPGAYRVFWCYGPERGSITIIAITPHP